MSKNKKAGKVFLILLCTVLLLLIAVAVLFYLRINNAPETLFDDPPAAEMTAAPTEPSIPTPETTPELSAAPTATPVPTPEPTPTPMSEAAIEALSDLSFMKNRVNIMVFGIDKSEEREASGSFRTDTMILVTVNFKKNSVDMISIPRDTYVKLYNKKGELIDELDPYNKINSAFSLGGGLKKGGYQSSMNTVSALLGGIPINYYVSVDMNAVKDVVNAMGGVTYDVDIEVNMNGRTLSPGLQHLDGQAVLDYCRQRKGSSDVARADRQQRMLLAIFNQMKSTGQIANIPKIYKAVESNIDTNLSFEQICALALVAVRMDFDDLARHMVPGAYMSLYDRDIWALDAKKLQELVKDVFNADITVDPNADGETLALITEQNRVAIAAELESANRAYADGKYLLNNYSRSIPSESKSSLKAAMSELSTAIRRENKALLDTCAPVVRSLADSIWASLGGSGPIPSGEYAGYDYYSSWSGGSADIGSITGESSTLDGGEADDVWVDDGTSTGGLGSGGQAWGIG
ncbi:MAG: LytR family transcriptional regulator [Clostridiales bacterium]|nr:LytR family transcriptional regulator [Clostridiales bacterium]